MRAFRKRLKILTLLAITAGTFLAPSALSDTLGAQLSHSARPKPANTAVPSSGIDIHYGLNNLTHFRVADGVAIPGTTKNGHGHQITLAYEYLALARYGKLGVGVQGSLYWVNDVLVEKEAKRASLQIFQLQPAVSYRFDYFRNQLLAPFVRAGLVLSAAHQTGAGIQGERYFSGIATAVGLEFKLDALDHETRDEMFQALGITSTFITLEYTNIEPLFEDQTENKGYGYRLGLRFEL